MTANHRPRRFRLRLPVFVPGLILGLLLLALPTSHLAASAQGANIRGIHTLAADRQAAMDQLSWASALVGSGGHVTQPFLDVGADTAGPTADAVAYVKEAYARQLDPILVLQGRFLNRDGCNASGYVGWLAPAPDPGTDRYFAEAAGYARFVAGLPRQDGRTLSIQVGNEPNLHEMWGGSANPAEYAHFLIDVAAAIRAIGDPRIQILNAALAPEGSIDNLQFIAQALEAAPAFAWSFDLWASHPYPRNQPPTNNLYDGTALTGSRYTIDAYRLELAQLAAHGVNTSNLQVILTETGYELGDHHFGEHPAVTEELRAEYMIQAYAQWARWPEIRAVTPFQLAGWYGTWRSFEWVYPTSGTGPGGLPTQPRAQYARLLAGYGVVSGTVRDDRGVAIDEATVVAEPGGYQATSLPDGSFLLLTRPGQYGLRITSDGHAAAIHPTLSVTAGHQTPATITLTPSLATSLRNGGFEDSDLQGWTRWGAVDGIQEGPWFFGISPSDGSQFLGTAVNCGEKDGGVHQSLGSTPGSAVTLSAHTLTHRDGATPITTRIGIDPWGGADPRSPNIIWSDSVETGGAWQSIFLTARAESDRLTVFLAFDQDAANPWNVSAFDDVRLEQTR
jgi:hypothetical protein